MIALQGGGPFEANDDLDRRLLAAAGADRVVVLPTADAFEGPATLVAAAMTWAERLDVDVDALMVLQRHDAEDEGAAEVVRAARAVYLVGDSSMHLRSALKDTPVLAALGDVLAAGGLVAAVGSSAAALCDPMLDQRGGAFTLGLGLVRGIAVVPGVGVVERGDAQPDAVTRRHAGRRAADRLGDRCAAPTAGSWSATRRSTASCRRHVSVISTRSSDDLLGRRVALARAPGRGSPRRRRALGDLAEHDVGAEGVEVRRVRPDREEPLRAGRVRRARVGHGDGPAGT